MKEVMPKKRMIFGVLNYRIWVMRSPHAAMHYVTLQCCGNPRTHTDRQTDTDMNTHTETERNKPTHTLRHRETDPHKHNTNGDYYFISN